MLDLQSIRGGGGTQTFIQHMDATWKSNVVLQSDDEERFGIAWKYLLIDLMIAVIYI